MELNINYKTIIKTFAVLIFIFAFLSILGQIYKFSFGHDRYIVSLFDLDNEYNLPTWFATMSLFLCSLILLLIGQVKKKIDDEFYLHWMILSIIFTFLSLDENIELHEQTIAPLRSFFHCSGIFYFAWVIPAVLLLCFLFFFLLKFIKSLPIKSRILFLFSGAVYVSGAIGGEIVSGYYCSIHQQKNLVYALIANVEEILEMTGVLIFIFSLLEYIRSNFFDLRIRVYGPKDLPNTKQ